MGTLRQKAATARRRLPLAWKEFVDPPDRGPRPEDLEPDNFLGRSVTHQPLASDEARATRRIHGRLSAEQLSAIESAVAVAGSSEEDQAVASAWRESEGLIRQRLDLVAGTYFDVPGLGETTGLLAVRPPDEVHAMSHLAVSTGGGFYEADMMSDALGSAGMEIAAGQRILDFGCSSGRVVRAMQAAWPEASFLGCDPNGPAIEWASANLPAIEFFKSENEPPLPLDDASLDAVVAVSIWSHYAERLGLIWFDEMHRVIKPGGLLAFTTHGPQAIAHYHGNGMRSDEQLTDIRKGLWDHGYWYAAEFGDKGDWGVVNSEWGTAFQSPEWFLQQLTPKWEFVEYAIARNHTNQDVYVLRRADR
jgi:SAM-dependent methyltransferase